MVVDQLPAVVGVDGSRAGDRALRYAVSEAKMRTAPLRVLCAYSWPPNLPALPMYLGVCGVDLVESRKCAERTVETAIAQVTAIDEDVKVDGAAVEGLPASVLIAASARADVLVVGSRQLRAVGSFVLGSVDDAVATHAHCPVVVTRGHDAPFDRDKAIVVGIDFAAPSSGVLAFGFEEARCVRYRCAW